MEQLWEKLMADDCVTIPKGDFPNFWSWIVQTHPDKIGFLRATPGWDDCMDVYWV